MKTTLFLRIYVLYCLFDLGIIIGMGAENSLPFKPFLMLPLFLATFFHADFATKKLVLAAIVFSWIGDVVLIFANIHALYFIGGLLAFLTVHILYIVLFYKEKQQFPPIPLALFQWIGFGIIALFLVTLLSILLPNIKDIQIPVCIYATTICSMLAMAFSAVNMWKTPANYWILGGAFTFVISDSILAFNRFYQPISNAALWIMITYLAAQFFIVAGILKLQSLKNMP
jgi:uncharacterized membrane protein YhhN